jgi:hypothetical protein
MMRTRGLPIVLGLVLWAPCSALREQKAEIAGPPTFNLQVRHSYPIASPPITVMPRDCDERGNVYFDIARPYVEANVLRISRDGQDVKRISFPTGLGKHGEWEYSVDPDGSLYALFSEAENHLLMHFSFSGTETSRITLSLPENFHVHSFVVLPDGRSMFFGSIPSKKTETEYDEIPSSIWLDPSGRVVRKTPPGKPFAPSTDRPDGLITAGKPGTFIEATTSKINLYSGGGELLRTFPIIKPTKDSFLVYLRLVDGQIALSFAYSAIQDDGSKRSDSPSVPRSRPLKETWLLVDPVSGELKAFYNQPEDLFGSAVCYLGNHEFLYLTVKDRRAWFVDASQ